MVKLIVPAAMFMLLMPAATAQAESLAGYNVSITWKSCTDGGCSSITDTMTVSERSATGPVGEFRFSVPYRQGEGTGILTQSGNTIRYVYTYDDTKYGRYEVLYKFSGNSCSISFPSPVKGVRQTAICKVLSSPASSQEKKRTQDCVSAKSVLDKYAGECTIISNGCSVPITARTVAPTSKSKTVYRTYQINPGRKERACQTLQNGGVQSYVGYCDSSDRQCIKRWKK